MELHVLNSVWDLKKKTIHFYFSSWTKFNTNKQHLSATGDKIYRDNIERTQQNRQHISLKHKFLFSLHTSLWKKALCKADFKPSMFSSMSCSTSWRHLPFSALKMKHFIFTFLPPFGINRCTSVIWLLHDPPYSLRTSSFYRSIILRIW